MLSTAANETAKFDAAFAGVIEGLVLELEAVWAVPTVVDAGDIVVDVSTGVTRRVLFVCTSGIIAVVVV